MPDICVLTGDFIASTRHSTATLEASFGVISGLTTVIEAFAPNTRLARTRGDGWQIASPAVAHGLRIALLIRAGLRADPSRLATRIAIASGPGPLPAQTDLNALNTPAFIASGRCLDTLRDIGLAHADGGAVAATTRLACMVSDGWTTAQAQAMVHALHLPAPGTTQIGRVLKKSRQAVDQALNSARWPALSDALTLLEAQ
ncbi:hypothetical protein BFP70_03185 [Thioclava sp. SK-1]|uniref:hypothetical protein n=1 Tax=Thioclava sp. SK-1 TaxID=1889770 RepID=UPI000826A9A1|nr:hypothetical protein [Thioclava sp. SK-1]OCX67176.1 hypothetical protein BFP70_03185 [Thioclava sp. SK-1]